MFVEAHTRQVLAAVCQHLGRSAARAALIRHHTNAVYAVDDLVVKIAPPGIDTRALRQTVAFTAWLCEQGFPTVGLHHGVEQPLEIEGYLVTVWERLDAAVADPVTPAELGGLLRRLHDVPVPALSLRVLEPLAGIRRSIDAAIIVSADDRTLLRDRLDALAAAWRDMRFAGPACVIHVDPQSGNALRRADGTPVLSDWDTAALGPREWDLATIAVHCRRFAQHDRHAFDRFCDAYGQDPRGWESFESLCRLRELKMIATNARKSQAGTPAAAEVHRRVAELCGTSESLLAWHIL